MNLRNMILSIYKSQQLLNKTNLSNKQQLKGSKQERDREGQQGTT